MGKEIKALYRNRGLTPPKGKGEHTKAFHKRAVSIMSSNKGMPKSMAYAIAMKQLGRDKSVNPSHRNPKYKKSTTLADVGR